MGGSEELVVVLDTCVVAVRVVVLEPWVWTQTHFKL